MAMNAVEKEHYEKCLEDGKEFQDYVVSMLIKHKGIAISSFSSLLFQYGIGEGYQGFEIKLDLPSANTGNLLIETGERTSKSGSWVKSGIHRYDNTDFYVVGNYKFFYLFDVKVLRRMEEKEEYLCKKETDTGQFFLLEQSVIEQDPPYIWKIECGDEGEELMKRLATPQNRFKEKCKIENINSGENK